MRQFINASDTVFAQLEQRAQTACVVFADQEMPPGATPHRARVGFEVRGIDGPVFLFVEKGVDYPGQSHEVKSWFEAGEKQFPNFEELKRWVRDELRLCYMQGFAAPNPSSAGDPSVLTDIKAVQKAVRENDTPLCISEADLFREMSLQVRGQDLALRILCKRVSLHVARLNPRRPTTLFAVGPTGVGKTRAAETLPQVLRNLDPHGTGFNYLRLDMSEYQESHRISQMLGAPQGYIGYGEGAQLTDALSMNPRTVVLFDEIEKAHPNILKALMNAMDAGRLSSAATIGSSREIDCRQAIFIFTSNLEAGKILDDLEQRGISDDPAVTDQLCRLRLRQTGIAPELIGRVTTFLMFHPLSIETRAEIITLSIVRVAEEYGVRVAYVEPAIIVIIVEASKGNEFGARPDEYLIDEMLGPAFARAAAAKVLTSVKVEVIDSQFTCLPIT
jgi:hypothetical protein